MSGRKLNIVVLRGGPSQEREVSLRTGAAVLEALRGQGYDVMDLVLESEAFSIPSSVNLAFLCLHGTFGEDGTVQALLDRQGIPYTGSDAAASRTAFNKEASKELFRKQSIPTPAGQLVRAGDAVNISAPLVLKPNCQGSSVGLQFVFDDKDTVAALGRARIYGDEVVAESLIRGRELTVGILEGRALPIVEIKPHEGVYDYKSKYTPGATTYICPAELSEEVTRSIQQVAVQAHHALGCSVYSRVDVMLDDQNHPWVLEVNTIPGMTATSLLPKAAAAAGLTFGELCEQIARLSLEARRTQEAA